MPRQISLSRRNVRGMGSMKKGNLEDGCFWINVKRAWSEQVFTRGFRFNECSTIRELGEMAAEDGLFREEHAPLPEGFTYDVEFSRGKSMFSEQYESDLVKDHFMGAETIHVKVFDEDGDRVMCIDDTLQDETGRWRRMQIWVPHTPESSRVRR
ncbi:hypothetical protein BDY24DRAFT_395693 [Mrakia frigida]|uniref:uncharacterized protein n=1 Tax=Mrakia frigida TaxID=29902 RepID=UPI003FCC23A7